MPRGDRSGPEGMGPMTGRGMGYCAGNPPAYGRGRGFYRLGMAFRRGWGGWRRSAWDFQPAFEPVNEKEWLKEEESFLKNQLEAIRERMQNLEEKPE